MGAPTSQMKQFQEWGSDKPHEILLKGQVKKTRKLTLNLVRCKSLVNSEKLAVLVAWGEDTRLTGAGSRQNGRKEHKNSKNKLFQK